MMELNGWIKIHRSILKWEWYDDANVCRLFLHLLLRANFEPRKWRGHDIPRGSLISSTPKLSQETGLSIQQVKTALKKLESTGEITDESTRNFRVITIKNYDKYQNDNLQINQQVTDGLTDDQPTNNRRVTTNKEYKNIKNVKEREEGKETKKERIYYPGDPALDAAFRDYVEMRKKIRAPMTDRAIELQMRKLQELATDPFRSGMDNDKAIKILEQSTMNNWKALYDLKPPREERDGEVDLAKLWRDVL